MSLAISPLTPTAAAELRSKLLEPGDPENLNMYVPPDDGMYKRTEKKHYFDVGRSALSCVQRALQIAGRPAPSSILDLPCGHGRVMRFLRAVYPQAKITACDLLRDGVAFCAQAFGAEPVYSSENVHEIPLRGRFDLIWCGSLLTHLDAPRWHEFLKFFARHLTSGGVCVFTVHGNYVVSSMRDFGSQYGVPDQIGMVNDWSQSGFGYRSYEHEPNYGISLSSAEWVRREIERVPQLRWLAHQERGWDAHQDVVVMQRNRRGLAEWFTGQ